MTEPSIATSGPPAPRRVADKLARYRDKRDFAITPEPRGERTRQFGRPRFVIQKHAARRLHYDLRLEVDGVFKSWAVTKRPSLDPSVKRLAIEVEDHPLEYGDFEGTIPEDQYGGGTVMLWDRGYWASDSPGDPIQAIAAGELKFTLRGDKLEGGFVLLRLRHDRLRGRQPSWLLIKHRDNHREPTRDKPREISARRDDTSVASGRSMARIARGAGSGPTPFITTASSAPASSRDPAAVWISGKPAAGASNLRAAQPKTPVPPGTAARQPVFVPPQLCTPLAAPPTTGDWAHEIKLDGYRIQLRVADGSIRLGTRKGLDWTDRFPQIAAAAIAAKLPDVIIDGEICALDENGVPDFAALQAALDQGRTRQDQTRQDQTRQDQTHRGQTRTPLVYFAFDLLYAEGRDLRDATLAVRKAALSSLLEQIPGRRPGTLRYVEHLCEPGDSVFRSACRMGLEGIVSKRLDAPYRSGRTRTWCKVKCRPGQEVVIAGWSGGARTLRSLLVGVHRAGKLTDAGRVGTGFDAKTAAMLLARLRPLATKDRPFQTGARPRTPAAVTWVRPELVAEIEFAGWTTEGRVRQASFKGLRSDKPPARIVAEPTPAAPPGKPDRSKTSTTVVMGVSISNPDKLLWPATDTTPPVTKTELARYLEQVSPWMMPYLAGRPCSLVRAPDGIDGTHFFQRHASQGMSDLISQAKVSGDRKPYLQLDRPEALAAAAQMGAVELHPWNCAPRRVEEPGRLVFDLDPGPDVPFADVVAAAREIRERLRSLGLESFCKTTGGKGLHVVAPLQPARGGVGWPAAKSFAREVCARMAADSPDRYLLKMTKSLRSGRIFLDYLRNDVKSTAVALLSPRARAGATVSMPLSWAQVRSGLDPTRFTIATAPRMMTASKAWADHHRAASPLAPAIKKLGHVRSAPVAKL